MISLGEGLADSVTMGVIDEFDSLWDEQAVSTNGIARATAISCLRTQTFKHEVNYVNLGRATNAVIPVAGCVI